MILLATQHREVTVKQGVWEGGAAKESNSAQPFLSPLHLRTPGPNKQCCFSPNWFHRVLLHQQANSSSGYKQLACSQLWWPQHSQEVQRPRGTLFPRERMSL